MRLLIKGPLSLRRVLHVSDRSSIKQLVQMGKNVERHTLVDAISLYLDHSIFVHERSDFYSTVASVNAIASKHRRQYEPLNSPPPRHEHY